VLLDAVHGLKIRAGDGWEERGHREMMSTSLFYYADSGDKITLLDNRYKYNVATYTADIEEKWINTFSYSPNQAWLVYNGDLNGDSYRQDEHEFQSDTYFRLCLRKEDGGDFTDEDINNILVFEKRDVLRFALLSDTHYVVNGTWESTAGAIWVASRRQKLDGIIHLGDITDGMLSKDVCKHYTNLVLGDLRAIGPPVWVTIGNHDTNYFGTSPDSLSMTEQCSLYLERDEPRYHVDFESHKLRLLFLDSYQADHELRYGYSPKCIEWVEQALKTLPDEWTALLFSHLTLRSDLQIWVDEIRGEKELLKVLEAKAHVILAFINGHQHGDYLCNDLPFPLVSIACSKCEYVPDRKPKGFITPPRSLADNSRDLWDILVVDAKARTLRFKRQGAGQDRMARDGKAVWL
jgi:WD40 repeat protein